MEGYKSVVRDLEQIGEIDKKLQLVTKKYDKKRKSLEAELKDLPRQQREETNELNEKKRKLKNEIKTRTSKLNDEPTIHEQNRTKCMMCLDNDANFLLDVCGHLILCSDCNNEDNRNEIFKKKECPYCREKISRRSNRFFRVIF